jgi:hypothetical protein
MKEAPVIISLKTGTMKTNCAHIRKGSYVRIVQNWLPSYPHDLNRARKSPEFDFMVISLFT